MSDPIISVILTELVTIMDQQIRREFRLVSGVRKEVEKLKSEFVSIRAVLVDAERRQVDEETVRVWLEKIKDVSYDTEDVLSEWITTMGKAKIDGLQNQSSRNRKIRSFFTLPCFGWNRYSLRRDIAIKIKKLNERLAEIAIERVRYKFQSNIVGNECVIGLKTASFVDDSEVQGRQSDKDTLIKKLLYPMNQDSGLNVVSVVGLGGIGKTTLVQSVYNSSDVEKEFIRMWVCVGESFDEVRVAKAILEDIEGSAPLLFELEAAARKIRDHIRGKKFLLVLDDVWTRDVLRWEQLRKSFLIGAPGSTILVTTRNERVAIEMDSRYQLRLRGLSDHDSWELFKKIAFHERSREDCERFGSVGRQISDKCKGFPLTIKIIGSLMREKKDIKEWMDVFNSEFWELKEAQGLFPQLMLSYKDLDPYLKQCFSFCAVFPKDHIIKADDLIKLWMAQGYLDMTKEKVTMEDTGHEFLQNLTMRSFFQDRKMEKDGKRILSVKMHDLVHDFAQYLTKNECTVLDTNCGLERQIGSSHIGVRHLTLIRSEDGPLPEVPNVGRLATYRVQSFYDCPPIVSQHEKVEAEFFDRLARLRALDLSHNRIGGLAGGIENLLHLKFLNLSHNPFQELPANLCDLFNLQTLKLSACGHLRKLPQDIGKLVNLRHLEIDGTDSLKTLPKGIGKMESLQTLSKFVIGRGRDGEAACEEDLSKLNNLRGCLKIEGLGFATNADEAKRAELRKKIHLLDINMDFGPASKIHMQEEVIEALQLHENVQSLHINSYKGSKLPNWIMALTHLQKLLLQDCTNCMHMTSLGRLPALTILHIEGAAAVKVLGLEFLGVGVNDHNRCTTNGEIFTERKVAFPKLKQLKISKMEMWEEWIVAGNESEDFEIMPRLRCLKILQCGKLKAVPIFLLQKKSMGKLRIERCPLVKEQLRREAGEKFSKISHIRKISVC